jgi:hypothetical protein
MDAHNISIVFGPALLQPPQEDTPSRDSSGSEPHTPTLADTRSSLTGSSGTLSTSMTGLSLKYATQQLCLFVCLFVGWLVGSAVLTNKQLLSILHICPLA